MDLKKAITGDLEILRKNRTARQNELLRGDPLYRELCGRIETLEAILAMLKKENPDGDPGSDLERPENHRSSREGSEGDS